MKVGEVHSDLFTLDVNTAISPDGFPCVELTDVRRIVLRLSKDEATKLAYWIVKAADALP